MNAIELRAWVADWQMDRLDSADLIRNFRLFSVHSGLPQQYDQVLEGILQRLESSSLFTEESCSFSKKDMADALIYWLDKASAAQG